ncbi:MAG: helix-turn-helix domain-containing protein [Roseiarcus sp.]
MSKVQFIVSPSGDELAILPRDEYERLVAIADDAAEDAADAAAYVEAKAEWEAEGQPVFPPELSQALLKHKSRLAAIRRWRGLSQETLAGKVDIQQGYLSDLETGRRSGAPATLARLASALDVPISWLA